MMMMMMMMIFYLDEECAVFHALSKQSLNRSDEFRAGLHLHLCLGFGGK